MGTLENLALGSSNIIKSLKNSLRRFLGDVFYLSLVVVFAYLLRREQMHKEETLSFSPANRNSLIIILQTADLGMLFLLLSYCKPTYPVLIPIVTKELFSGVLASLQWSFVFPPRKQFECVRRVLVPQH